MEIAEIQVSYKTNNTEKTQLNNSQVSYNFLLSCWDKNTIELQEEFKVLLLNRHNKLLGVYTLSKGGTSQTTVDIKLLFSVVLKANANSIIVAHNHPSGGLLPSKADKNITSKIVKASKFLDIRVLDHIIVTKSGYFSFADDGLI